MDTIKHGYRIQPDLGVVLGRRGAPARKISGGYICIERWPEGSKFVHRIIWESVNGPVPEGLQINHINGVREDNRISNLELVTGSENTAHAYMLGLRSAEGESNGRAKLTEADVREIRSLRGRVSGRELGERFSVSARTISDVWTRRNWRNVA